MISKSSDLTLLSETIQVIFSDNQVMQYLPLFLVIIWDQLLWVIWDIQ